MQVHTAEPILLWTDRARDKFTGKIYALKKVRMEREKDGLPLTSLRGVHRMPPQRSTLHYQYNIQSQVQAHANTHFETEIRLLKAISHPNIVTLHEVVVGREQDKYNSTHTHTTRTPTPLRSRCHCRP